MHKFIIDNYQPKIQEDSLLSLMYAISKSKRHIDNAQQNLWDICDIFNIKYPKYPVDRDNPIFLKLNNEIRERELFLKQKRESEFSYK